MDSLFEKKLITTKDAAESSGYTPDYLARLVRSGKISGRRIGHSWLIDKESLAHFLRAQEDRKVEYARTLARAREEEYLLHQGSRRGVMRFTLRTPGKKNLLTPQTEELSKTFLMPPEGIGKSSLRSQLLALSVATVVVASGALMAQAAALPQLASRVALVAQETAFGFKATFGTIPYGIVSKITAAEVAMHARTVRVAAESARTSAQLTSPLLAEFKLSLPRTQFSKERPARSDAFAFVPTAVAPPTPLTFEGVRSSVLATYGFLTTPSRVANSLLQTYTALGTNTYAAVIGALSAYQSLIVHSGQGALALGAATRDTLATVPHLVLAADIAFGASVVSAAHAAIHADVALAYGIAVAAPASARTTVALVGGLGDALARGTARTPALATTLFLRATQAPSVLAPALAEVVFSQEYAGATRFVALTNAVSERYLALVFGTGNVVYTGTAGALALTHAVLPLSARAPAALENAYLGMLGKSSLAFDGLGARISSLPQVTTLAAALPALSAGEQAALFTYQTLHGLFDSATGAFSSLFGAGSNVAVVSNPPSTVLPFGTSTVPVTPLRQPTIPAAVSPRTAPTMVTNYPTYTTVVQGVSQDFVTQSLAALRSNILATVAGMVQPVAAQGATNMTSIQQVNMIQDLSNLTVRNGSFLGGTFDSGSVTNGISVSATSGHFDNLTGGTASFSTTTLTGPFTTTGNVGIGTSTPGSLLSLGGIANFTAATSTFYSSGGLNLAGGCFAVNGTCFGGGGIGSGTTGQFPYYAANGTTLSATSSLFLASSGNIGIGTTSPWAQLSVNPNGITGPAFVIGSSTATNFIVTNAGNVGIGASPPSNAQLGVVGGSSYYTQYVQGSGQYVSYIEGGGSSSYPVQAIDLVGTDRDGLSVFADYAKTDGNLAILSTQNATFSGTGLTMNFGQYSGGAFTGNFVNFINSGGTGSNSGPTEFSVSSNGSVYTAGNIGIGTTSPAARLDLTNSATSSAAVILRDPLGNVSFELRAGTSTLNNTFVGYQAGKVNTTGSSNTALGNTALYANTTGNYNTAIGASALYANTTGSSNTAIGLSALYANTTGYNNIALGSYALYSNTTGYDNNAFGLSALYYNTTGYNNVASGINTLLYNTTGYNNVATGPYALFSNTTGYNNVATGPYALYYNTTGFSNTALGPAALRSNTTGSSNTASGIHVLDANTTGSNNVASGYYALYYNASATSSTAIGYYAGAGTASYSNQGGTYLGYQAGYSAATGSDYNTLVGYQSGYGDTTGTRNVLIGQSTIAASYNQVTTGSNNIAIGNDVALASPTASNQLNIGNLIYGTGLNGTGATLSTGSIGIGTTSPWRTLSVNGSSDLGTNALAGYFTATSTTATSTFAGFIDVNGTGTNATSTFASNLWVKGALKVGIASIYLTATGIHSTDGTINIVTGTTATSSFSTVSTDVLNVSSTTATSTFANGINLSAGCFAINGGCVGIGSGTTGQFPYYAANGTTLSATSSLFLASSGNIGIGTTSPWAQLSVNPNGITGPAFAIGSSTATNFIVTNGGNVGIGTTNPSQALSVVGSGVFSGNLFLNPAGSSNAAPSAFGFSPSLTSGQAVRLQFGDTANTIQNAYSDRMQVASYWGLELRGNQENSSAPAFATGTNSDASVAIFGTYGNASNILSLNTNAGTVLDVVSGNGSVGIGTTSPYRTLSVAGSGVFTGGDVLASTLTATSSITANSLSLTTALPVTSGGTGWSSIQTGTIPYGNGSSALATTTAGTAGYVLAFLNGVPTWAATTTFSSGLAYANGAVTNTGVLSLAPQYGSAATGALTIASSTTGTDFSITGSGSTLTFALPSASASARGLLSSADWTTFNGKLGSTTISALSANYIPKWNGSSFQNSLLYDTGTNIGIGTTSPAARLDLTNSATSSAAVILRDPLGNISFELRAGTSTLNNSFVGSHAGKVNTTGYSNTGIGGSALVANTTGYENTATGLQALYSNTTGYDNAANGAYALYSNTTGYENTANGAGALYLNTTGPDNTATGLQALYNNTSGSDNVVSGVQALYSNTTGSYNTSSGNYSLYYNSTGYYNTAVGNYALLNNGSGSSNTAVGHQALYNTTGGYVTAIGDNAGYANSSGSNNTFIGASAGNSGTTGTLTNATAIGYNAQVTASNALILGGTGANAVNVGIGTTSPWAQLSISNSVTTPANTPLFTIASTTGGTSTTTLMTVLANGSVGIGTTSPADFLNGTAGKVLDITGTNPILTLHNSSDPFKEASFYNYTSGLYIDSVGAATSSNNAIYFRTNNTSSSTITGILTAMTISSSGTIGIGTTSPTGLLTLSRSSTTTVATPSNSALTLDNASGTGSQTNISFTSAGVMGGSIRSDWLGNLVINPAGSGNLYLGGFDAINGTPTGMDLFYAGGAERMRITGSGNVGIGTTTPTSTLTVTGSGCFDLGPGTATLACGTAAGNIYYQTANTGAYDVAENYLTQNTLPAATLVGLDAANPGFITMATNATPLLGVVSTAPGMVLGGADASTAGKVVAPVALSGRVPVAVSGANGPIAIGDRLMLSSTTPGVAVKAVHSGETIGIALAAYTGSGTGKVTMFVSPQYWLAPSDFSIDPTTGSIGIGTTTPNHTLTVAGDIGAIAFVNTSTRAAKDDISYVDASTTESMLNQLLQLKVATYRYKIENQNDPLRLGFIAEDAQKVAPEVLSPDGKGVDLYKLATFTLSGVQVLAARQADLTARVDSLEARMAKLDTGAISTASGSPVTFSSSTLASALSGFGVFIEKGIAQFNTVVFHQLVASTDANGTSSAGSVTILKGNTVAQVNNSLVLPSTKVFITFNAQVTGSWWVSDKADGSFRVVLSAPQASDVSFDYFLVQTEGQIATSSPDGSFLGAPSVSQNNGPDTVPPVITLIGDNPVHISVGGTFVEPGVTVTDNVDGTDPYITFINGIQQPVSSTTIDTASPTTYLITYKATDQAGNSSTAMRSVIVGNPDGTVSIGGGSRAGSSTTSVGTTTAATSTPSSAGATTGSAPSDTTPPVVTLNGAAAMQITVGDTFTDPGATATDTIDGNLTSKIKETGKVDTTTAGLYTLTYSATDAAGNTASVSRVVTVAAAPAPVAASSTPPTLPPPTTTTATTTTATSTAS